MSVPLIETKRLLLRPFLTTDAEALFAYASAPEFSQYVEYSSPNTLQEVQDFLQQVLMAADPDCLSWAICQRDQSQLIGSVQMTREAVDRMSVHYDVSHTVYGNGFATEALRGVLQWGLMNLPEVTQFCGDTQASNVASRRVMEKCGLVPFKTENVVWEKFDQPVELVFYSVEREVLQTKAQISGVAE